MGRRVGVIGESVQDEFDGVDELQMELLGGRLCVLTRKAELTEEELAAFRRGPINCSFFSPDCPVPLALWTFLFDAPFPMVEVPFDLKSLEPEEAAGMPGTTTLAREGILFLLYQGDVLVESIEWCPPRTSLRRFVETLRRQRTATYSHEDCLRWLEAIESFTVEEIFEMGRVGGRGKKRRNVAEVAIQSGPCEIFSVLQEATASKGILH